MSSPATAVAGRGISLRRQDRRLLDHRLQGRDLGREAAGHHLREAPVESAERLGLEEMTPRGRPPLQLDLRPEEMLDLDDPLIEKREVGHRAGRSVLEVKSDLEAPSRTISPHLKVNPIVAVVELEQHRVHPVPELRQLRWQVRPRIGHDHREEITPVETRWSIDRSACGCHGNPLALRRLRLAR
jgi:hypothetical protein